MDNKEKSQTLTHWKSGNLKSPYLGSWDLPNFNNVQLTISNVKKQMTSGLPKNSKQNIAHFKENVKPMLINATNAKILRAITGSPFVEKWVDIKIELRVERDIEAFGAVHDCLRIVNKKIAIKTLLTKDHPRYKEIKDKLDAGAKRSVIEKYFDLSKSGL